MGLDQGSGLDLNYGRIISNTLIIFFLLFCGVVAYINNSIEDGIKKQTIKMDSMKCDMALMKCDMASMKCDVAQMKCRILEVELRHKKSTQNL